jgi:N-acetylglucosaminyldiphosphoundecaprenol N-acetyl-beta-D-mannosaminyltransferase
MSLVAINPGSRGQVVSAEAGTTSEVCHSAVVGTLEHADDLSRNVYCVLGVPIDAIDMTSVIQKIETAAAARAPFLISTPNLNFLVNSRSDPEFRESLFDSDLCPVDGMPIVWIARLLGLPIKQRVSGSDIFDALNRRSHGMRRLKVFLFGGAAGVAAMAAKTLNAASPGLNCVGSFDPGFGTVEEMSCNEVIAAVNASEADFLAVSLGAAKGQEWLHRNHGCLTIPVRAHLGAAINFQAGTIKRAPPGVRALGLEWLWRIKEEPRLWWRYWRDGWVLLRLLVTRILPLAIVMHRYRQRWREHDLQIKTAHNPETLVLRVSGDATEPHIPNAIPPFREALTARKKSIVVDLSETRSLDQRFLGIFLMFRKKLKQQNVGMKFVGQSRRVGRIFRLNDLGFLLEEGPNVNSSGHLHRYNIVTDGIDVPARAFFSRR